MIKGSVIGGGLTLTVEKGFFFPNESRFAALSELQEDQRNGGAGSVTDLLRMEGFNHRVDITKGVLMEECRDMMQAFFKQLRLEKAKEKQIDSEEKEKEKQI